jgi:hypothetical protein
MPTLITADTVKHQDTSDKNHVITMQFTSTGLVMVRDISSGQE